MHLNSALLLYPQIPLLSTHIFKKFFVFSISRFYSRIFVEILHFPSFLQGFCGKKERFGIASALPFHGVARKGSRHFPRCFPAETAARRSASSPSPSPAVTPLPLGELPSKARLRGQARFPRKKAPLPSRKTVLFQPFSVRMWKTRCSFSSSCGWEP